MSTTPSMQAPLQASEGSELKGPPPVTFMPLPHVSDAQRAVSAESTAATSAALEVVNPPADSGHSAEEAQSAAQGQLRPSAPLEAEAVETEEEAAAEAEEEAAAEAEEEAAAEAEEEAAAEAEEEAAAEAEEEAVAEAEEEAVAEAEEEAVAEAEEEAAAEAEAPEPAAAEVVEEAEGLRLHLNAENATGYRGCYLVTNRQGLPAGTPFKATVDGSNGRRHLGYFATAVEAALCYARHVQAKEAVVAEGQAAGVPATAGAAGAAGNPRDAAHRRWGMQHSDEAAAPPLPQSERRADSRAERVRSVKGESSAGSSAAPAQARVSTRRGGVEGMRCGCRKPLQMLQCDELTCDVCESRLTQSSTVSLARPA